MSDREAEWITSEVARITEGVEGGRVWIRGGRRGVRQVYHGEKRRVCPHVLASVLRKAGPKTRYVGRLIRRSQARALGLRPCPSCGGA